ncbi:MAG: hypothetical protein ACHQZQ_06955 [SAR324 cluster bacterium]
MESISEGLLRKIRALEVELETELAQHRAAFQAALHERAAGLEQEWLAAQRKLRLGLYRFLRDASIGTYLAAPIIYALALPIGLLDIAVTVYQWTCFPAYGIPRVQRRRYVALDRRLPFLNAIEKLNCVYCGYANGVLAYATEIASRTEQYWCPIKHARRIAGVHPRYYGFLNPTDAEGYRSRLEEMRKGVQELGKDES